MVWVLRVVVTICCYAVHVDAPTVHTGEIDLGWPHWAEIQLPCGHTGARGTEDPRPHFCSRETAHNGVGKKLSFRSWFSMLLLFLLVHKLHVVFLFVSWRPQDQSVIGHASLCWLGSVMGLSWFVFIVTNNWSLVACAFFFMVVLLIVILKSLVQNLHHWRQACKSVQQVVQGIYLRKGGKTCRRQGVSRWSTLPWLWVKTLVPPQNSWWMKGYPPKLYANRSRFWPMARYIYICIYDIYIYTILYMIYNVYIYISWPIPTLHFCSSPFSKSGQGDLSTFEVLLVRQCEVWI